MAELSAFDNALADAEQAVQSVSVAILGNQPDAAHNAALQLQAATSALTHALATARRTAPGARLDAHSTARLRALSRALAQHRESCLRRGGMAERALEAIVPATRSATYQGGMAATGYARGQPRQTGAFRVLSA